MVAVGDDLAHQRGVVGGDVVADELGHVGEAHDPVVEAHPLVHVAELDVADDVVEGLEQPLRLALAALQRARPGDPAGQVGAVVAAAVDQGVHGLAVRRDRGDAHRAVLVGDVLGLADHGRAGAAGLGDAAVDVGHLERDVDDAVAVAAVVVGQRAVGVDGAVEHEADRAGAQHEALVVAVAGLGAGVGLELHAPGGLVVVRGLGGVADHEDDRVPAGHREDVALGVVLHQADERLELLEAEVGAELVLGERAARRGREWSGRWARSWCPSSRPAWREQDILCNRTSTRWTTCPTKGAVVDDLDRKVLDVFARHPRVGVLEASRRLGVARGTVQARLDRLSRRRGHHRVGPGALAGGARLPRDGVPDPGDPPGDQRGRRPRRRRAAPRRDPGGARGPHHHRRRRPHGPRGGALERRPAAGHRRGAGRAPRSCGPARSSRWPTQVRYRVLPLATAPLDGEGPRVS